MSLAGVIASSLALVTVGRLAPVGGGYFVSIPPPLLARTSILPRNLHMPLVNRQQGRVQALELEGRSPARLHASQAIPS